MKKYLVIISLLLAIIILPTCDKIKKEEFIKKDVSFIWKSRKVVILDFTAHSCGQCPKAHRLIDDLMQKYENAIIPIAIHCTKLADPSAKRPTNFRTETGDQLSEAFGTEIEGLPFGTVNLVPGKGIDLLCPDAWPEQVVKYVEETPLLSIKMADKTSIDDKKITVDVLVKTDIKNNRKLSIASYILESNIVAAQDDPATNPEYVHNHVLRGALTPSLGESLKDNNDASEVGTIIKKTFSSEINPEWVINNCEIVALVFDSETKEVLQAEIIHLLDEK